MNNIILYLTAFSLSFFSGIQTAMAAVGFLVVIDTVLGLLASKKLEKTITSRKFSRILTKLLVFNLLIISAHLCELYLIKLIPLVSITLGFLAVSEFLSISESFTVITEMDFVNYLKSKADIFISNKTKDENETNK